MSNCGICGNSVEIDNCRTDEGGMSYHPGCYTMKVDAPSRSWIKEGMPVTVCNPYSRKVTAAVIVKKPYMFHGKVFVKISIDDVTSSCRASDLNELKSRLGGGRPSGFSVGWGYGPFNKLA